MSEFILGDCMEHLKEYPDGYFELAIVDPPYGGVTKGGYMENKVSGGVARNRNDYHLALWAQKAPEKAYFDELRRVSKNQIIWGVITLRTCYHRLSAGWYGTRKEQKVYITQTANLRGRRLIKPHGFSGSSGTACYKAT